MLDDPIHQLRIVPPEEAPKNGKIRVKLISPLKEVFSMEADKVLLPAVDGDILILPDRAPIFISLKAGRMVIYNKGEENINYLISAGICEVRRNLCPVLAWGVQEDKYKLTTCKKDCQRVVEFVMTTVHICKKRKCQQGLIFSNAFYNCRAKPIHLVSRKPMDRNVKISDIK